MGCIVIEHPGSGRRANIVGRDLGSVKTVEGRQIEEWPEAAKSWTRLGPLSESMIDMEVSMEIANATQRTAS